MFFIENSPVDMMAGWLAMRLSLFTNQPTNRQLLAFFAPSSAYNLIE